MRYPKEIEVKTMLLWLDKGTIEISSVGSENVYFVDQFDNEFFCKCYPQEKVVIQTEEGDRVIKTN